MTQAQDDESSAPLEVIRAFLVPGLQDERPPTEVLIAASGLAGCSIHPYRRTRAQPEPSLTYQFSPQELREISLALERVAQEPQLDLTIDDVPIRGLIFHLSGQPISRKIPEFPFQKKKTIHEGSEAFRAAWDLIHKPFKSILGLERRGYSS